MEFWIVILLGLIQGLTEFLPVSSSGHLVLVENIFGINVDYTLLNVILHFATLLAVCWYYRKRLWDMIRHPFQKQNLMLILATLPAVAFVLLFNSFVDTHMDSMVLVGIGFLITAALLVLAEVSQKKITLTRPLNIGQSLLMGLGQAFAIFPGLSRSGTTLAVGLASGVKKQEALDFSFLMSIPIILGSLIYELCDNHIWQNALDASTIIAIILGAIIAFFVAILSIRFMQKIVSKMKLWWFVPYLCIIGIITIVLGK